MQKQNSSRIQTAIIISLVNEALKAFEGSNSRYNSCGCREQSRH